MPERLGILSYPWLPRSPATHEVVCFSMIYAIPRSKAYKHSRRQHRSWSYLAIPPKMVTTRSVRPRFPLDTLRGFRDTTVGVSILGSTGLCQCRWALEVCGFGIVKRCQGVLRK